MAFDPSTFVAQYTDPQEEARACRSECALFDFSFVARARVAGADAVAAIGQLTRRPLDGLLPGRIAYAVREDERGHLVSDLTIWHHGDWYEVMSGRTEDISELVESNAQNLQRRGFECRPCDFCRAGATIAACPSRAVGRRSNREPSFFLVHRNPRRRRAVHCGQARLYG